MFGAKHIKMFIKGNTKKPKTGSVGEKIAAAYLIKKGYKILTKNYRQKFGEIDIVARSADGTLVFCEVKTNIKRGVFTISFGPEDNASRHKLSKMRRIANFFAAKHSDLILEEQGWRIDLVAIVLEIVSTEKGEAENKIIISSVNHYENVA